MNMFKAGSLEEALIVGLPLYGLSPYLLITQKSGTPLYTTATLLFGGSLLYCLDSMRTNIKDNKNLDQILSFLRKKIF